MTDARLPERWLVDRRFNRLTDKDYRSFMQLLVWTVSNRTDGYVESDDLAAVPHYDPASTHRLIVAGLLEDADDDRFYIVDYPKHQSTRAQLEAGDANRLKEAERKRNQRARGNRDKPRQATDDSPPAHPQTGELVDAWPTVMIPDDEPF